MTATIGFGSHFEMWISSVQRLLNLPITLRFIILAFLFSTISSHSLAYRLQKPQNDNQMSRIMIPPK